jgi:hypothetical protein
MATLKVSVCSIGLCMQRKAKLPADPCNLHGMDSTNCGAPRLFYCQPTCHA